VAYLKKVNRNRERWKVKSEKTRGLPEGVGSPLKVNTLLVDR
jgi:hypothetical protein